MKDLDINKLRETKEFTIGSTKEALKDVIPIEWSEEVMNGSKKVNIYKENDIKISDYISSPNQEAIEYNKFLLDILKEIKTTPSEKSKENGRKLIEEFESIKDKATDIANKSTTRNEQGYVVLSKEEWNEEVLSEERYCTIEESLEQSLKEMQLMRQGKLPKKTWRELRAEMDKW